jgi:multicomponent Na+:H+ antiporter subunit E
MPAESTSASRTSVRAWIVRWAGYFAFWVLLIGIEPADLAVGVFAATFATWASLVLLPPGMLKLRASDLPRYFVHFMWQSVVAGIDVARRAFSPRLPLQPGVVSYSCRYPRGAARNVFASVTSLTPGTLAVEETPEGLSYHCLDISQPIAVQLAQEEVQVSRLLPCDPAA